MRVKITTTLYLFLIMVLAAGCASSNDVASNGLIQKRKYTKGLFVKTGFKKSSLRKNNETDLLVESKVKEKATQKEAFDKLTTNHEQLVENTQNLIIEQNAIENKEVYSSSVPTTKKLQKTDLGTIEKQHKKTVIQDLKTVKATKKLIKKATKQKDPDEDLDPLLLYILAFFIPFLAVGLATDWNTKDVVINILLCCLCGLPGIIHAIIIVGKNV